MRYLGLSAAFAALLFLAPHGAAIVDGDGDNFPDAVEQVLGTNPYDGGDDPSQVGLNAITNPGFDLQTRPVSAAVTCPVFGDLSVNIVGLVIVSPCFASALNTPAWNNGQLRAADNAAQARDADGDGDAEMVVPAQPFSSHNFWHPFANAQQAFSANFDKMTFDIELDGVTRAQLPNSAYIAISVALTPFNDLHQFAVLYVECSLSVTKSQLLSAATFTTVPGPGGRTYLHVSIDPTAMAFRAYTSDGFEGCNNEEAAWGPASAADRRAMLGTMRLVQVSFWGWNGAVIDNVDLRGSTPALGVPDEILPGGL